MSQGFGSHYFHEQPHPRRGVRIPQPTCITTKAGVDPKLLRRDVFSQKGSSFVPDGTRFVVARSPSDESLGYFRASFRDLGSRCVLMRSKSLVAGERFPFGPRMTRVSRMNTDSKVPSGTTDNSPRFQPWVADARRTRAPQGRKKATQLAPSQNQRGGSGRPLAQILPSAREERTGRMSVSGAAIFPLPLRGSRWSLITSAITLTPLI